MFESYSDTLTIPHGQVAGPRFYAAVSEHIANPSGPVRVIGGPGTGKVYALRQTAREAGYRVSYVLTNVLNPGDEGFVRGDLEAADRDSVLVVDQSDGPGPRGRDPQALRELAKHPRVHAVFVVDTPASF